MANSYVCRSYRGKTGRDWFFALPILNRAKEDRWLTKKKGRSKRKQNKTKLIVTALTFKKPMNYDRFEWSYVNRSMLKVYHDYWHYRI